MPGLKKENLVYHVIQRGNNQESSLVRIPAKSI